MYKAFLRTSGKNYIKLNSDNNKNAINKFPTELVLNDPQQHCYTLSTDQTGVVIIF
jgi:hypothetical protein